MEDILVSQEIIKSFLELFEITGIYDPFGKPVPVLGYSVHNYIHIQCAGGSVCQFVGYHNHEHLQYPIL